VDVRDLKGILKRETNKIVSIEEMNAAIVRGATTDIFKSKNYLLMYEIFLYKLPSVDQWYTTIVVFDNV
jgi:hypothetical protein